MPDLKLNLPLRDWTVLSLRPHGQHAVAHGASQLRGAKFLACSSMALEAIENDAAFINALSCNHIIVTSPAAARFAVQNSKFKVDQKSHWFALGEGTASVLKKNGVNTVSIPDNGSHSENLLAMAALENIAGQRVGLITAPGGRGLIETTLMKRGAEIHVANMYQRIAIAMPAEQLQPLQQLQLPFAVLCTSHEIFQSFWQQIDAMLKKKLASGLWIVSSVRLRELLSQAGISRLSISPSPQPEAMLAHLEHVQTQQVR